MFARALEISAEPCWNLGAKSRPLLCNPRAHILGAKSRPLFCAVYGNIYCAEIWAGFRAQILVGKTFNFGLEIRPAFLFDFHGSPRSSRHIFFIYRGRQRRAAQPLCGNLGGISRLDSGRDFLSRIWARSPSCFGRAHLFRGMAKQPRMEPSTTTLCPIYRPCLHNTATFFFGKRTRTARAIPQHARARMR